MGCFVSCDMIFDGQTINWMGIGVYRATSGMRDQQYPEFQCIPDAGPIPEGVYRIFSADLGTAKDDGRGICALSPAWGVQRIPRGERAGACEPYWANWGNYRAKIEPADEITKQACLPVRSGFFIHDSTKGYSHGCIEVEPKFFETLFGFKRKKLFIKVKYVKGVQTNGGTKV